MLAEAPHVKTFHARVSWVSGIISVLIRLSVRNALTDDGHRPVELTAAALYLGGISGYVLLHFVFETAKGVREHWAEAWVPVVICFWLSAIPALIAIGIWICDDFARKFALAFLALQLIETCVSVSTLGFAGFRAAKFVCDVALIGAMISPRVMRACAWRADSVQKPFHL
jgi:hypothetical protein